MRLAVPIVTNVIFRRAWIIGVPCRSNLYGVIPFGRLKHLLLRKIVAAFSEFELHFDPIQKYSANAKIKRVYPRNFSNCKCSNNHTSNNQSKQMTPNKPQYFHRNVQSILQFMNGLNLHLVKLNSFNIYRIAQIALIKLKIVRIC